MTVSPQLMSRIRQDVQSMHAYAIQDSVGMVKLDAMENPYRLPPELQKALGERLGALALNRYPDGRVNDLRRALAAHAGMPEGYDIMLGNGSDELISLLALACDVPGASILAPVPGFVMYAMSAQLQGLEFHGVPLTVDFELDEAAFHSTLARFGELAKARMAHPAMSSMLKYYGAELNKRRWELMMQASGSQALEWESERTREGAVARTWLRSKGNSIEGGTSEVQLNVIAKRILELPGA